MLCEGDVFAFIGIPDPAGAHEDISCRPVTRSIPGCMAKPAGRLGDKPVGRSEEAFEGKIVPQAGDGGMEQHFQEEPSGGSGE